MSFTVFLGNLPAWVTADDIRGWLAAESLVADAIKVIRNPETQESKGFAFIEAPNTEEMNAIIRRFDRAPLEDRLLRANPAQPPKPRGQVRPGGPGMGPASSAGHGSAGHMGSSHTVSSSHGSSAQAPTGQNSGHTGSGNSQTGSGHTGNSHGGGSQGSSGQGASGGFDQRPPRRGKKSIARKPSGTGTGPSSAFAEELAKAL
jgi:RNA recognition motif-containing protein